MSASEMQSRDKSKVDAAAVRIDGFDFALLGLKANEARASLIRKAAGKIAKQIKVTAVEPSEAVEMRSHLVTSTYRLLDPRRRQRGWERIQLSLYTEEDMAAQRNSRRPLLDGPLKAPARSEGGVAADLVA